MKQIIRIIFASILALFMTSCYYDAYYEEIAGDGDGEPTPNVSYANDIQPLWDAACVACHNGNTPPDLRPDTSWDALQNGWVEPGDAESSRLYQSLLGTNGAALMPPGGWPQAEINLVRDWINQGAEDN